ncbi:MAG: hypothetical protein ACTS22_03595 [Phycisphaerales bacterium]
MASGGAKNVVLTVIAIGAIGAAIYLIVSSMGSGGSKQEQNLIHFVDEGSLDSGDPAGVTLTVSEFRTMQGRGTNVVASNGSTEIVPAGLCPNGHYYPLGGHGAQPPACPTCSVDLAGYDANGDPK